MNTIAVNASALRELLQALNGPAHLVLELMALRGPLVGKDNPINILTDQYNTAAEQLDIAPTLEDDTFLDKAVAGISIRLADNADGGMTNAIDILARQIDVRGDESGGHPGESFVMISITREEVAAMLSALDDDWADHIKYSKELPV